MRRALGSERGVSLIELVIAVLILSIGAMAGYRALSQARRGIGEEVPRLLAHQAALNRAEELRLLGMEAGRALPETVRLGPYDWRIDVTEAATEGGFVKATVHAGGPDRPGALAVVHVRPDAPR